MARRKRKRGNVHSRRLQRSCGRKAGSSRSQKSTALASFFFFTSFSPYAPPCLTHMLSFPDRKRPSTRSPGLPIELRALWSPLLSHFDNLYDGALSETITRRGIDMLCAGTATSTATAEGLDRTYAACVVAWVAELLKDAPLGEIPNAEVVATADGIGQADADEDEEEEESEEVKELTIKNVLRTCLLSRSLQCVLVSFSPPHFLPPLAPISTFQRTASTREEN